jgi:hypothetical protein
MPTLTTPTIATPWIDPGFWRETCRPPLRACGRKEHARLLELVLAMDWVRLNPVRREVAENLVWWAEEHLDTPAHRDWFVRSWRRNRAQGLLQAEAMSDDITRAFRLELKRARKWCATPGHAHYDARFETRFMESWANLRDDSLRVKGLFAALHRILNDNPVSFETAFKRLEVLEEAADAYSDHQLNPRCLCRSPRGFAWFLHTEASSEIEGQWLKHCGNTAAPRPGDRLVSLRELVVEHEVECWRPRLTGVLDARGWLVELKGASNTKPSRNYHYLIAWLIAQPAVKGVGTGLRSLREKDFRWWDMDHELRWWVLDRRPGLRGLNYASEEVDLEVIQRKRPTPPLPPHGWRDYLRIALGVARVVGFAVGFFLFFTLITTLPVAIVEALVKP